MWVIFDSLIAMIVEEEVTTSKLTLAIADHFSDFFALGRDDVYWREL